MTRLRRRRGIRPTGTVSGPITPLSLSMVAVAQRSIVAVVMSDRLLLRALLRKRPRGRGATCQMPGAVVARQSFSRLWVAVISRHSERQAALPRRWKRSILRLNLVSPKTGSIIGVRLR